MPGPGPDAVPEQHGEPTTWVPGATGSLFDLDHLPYGVFARGEEEPRVGVRIGDHVLDLAPIAAAQMLEVSRTFQQPSLNELMGYGPELVAALRRWIVGLLTQADERPLVEPHLVPLTEVTLSLPIEVADYVDFYASEHHATNVGRILRPDGEPLLANWKHLPVGYHGRAGTVVASGTPIRRPSGQRRGGTFGPSARLDVEAELGFVVGVGSTLGTPVPCSAFAEHVFGVVGLNDWSARDIQAWEYQPLGPFLGKSFATSISHWVTPLAALDAAWVDPPPQDPEPLPYLAPGATRGLDLDVEIEVNGRVVSRPAYRTMYWSPAQMLAHLTVNGASLRTGDLFGSGTISGPEPGQRGCLLELGWGEESAFLADGDEVVLRYTAPGTGGGRIGLGEVRGGIASALPTP
ncbi:fumarylacetoacetase [Nocardioides acrostichi]|uniref:fumarylacetoacetase n=1 Tax=Nocardioides acrostichi TaxID=2784339 RepID=A0A930UYY1_9ACTN|nr:fumarylacetoacetase [Nocardioides acrostichi]MBF4163458.1 fumarylacetoacetase [Nocardioides acrostichi]